MNDKPKLSPKVKFDLQQFGEKGDQSGNVVFEIDGEQVPFSDMTPDHFGKVYDVYKNQNQFSSSNTQKAQALAKERDEFEAERDSYRQKMEYYDQWEQFLRSQPELYNQIMSYVQKAQGGQAMPTGQQNSQQGLNILKPHLDPLEKRIVELEKALDENSASSQRRDALEHLAQNYKGFNKDEFLDFFTNKSGDFNNLTDIYNLAYLASIGAKSLEQQQKQGSGLETGTGTSGNVPENIVIDENEGDPMDQVFEKYAEQKGISDY